LGRDSRLFLLKSKTISERVLKILETNLKEASQSAVAKDWAKKLAKEIEYAFKLLGAFQKGITHKA
jgi:hypothetical protein